MWPPEVIINDVTHRTVFTEANVATATAGEVTGSFIYGLILKTVCGGRWQICERVMLKRRKRRKKINTCCVLLQNNLICIRFSTTFECGLNQIWKCQIQCDLCCSHCQKQIRYGSHLSKQIGFRSLLTAV